MEDNIKRDLQGILWVGFY